MDGYASVCSTGDHINSGSYKTMVFHISSDTTFCNFVIML